jgi:putative chitinase
MINRKIFFDEYKKEFSKNVKQSVVDCLDAIFNVFDKHDDEPIRKNEKRAYMLATVRHEVGADMIPIVENMNYSAKRIMQVWPSRFKSLKEAAPYANNPEKLGNNVYGNRLGNGPESSGDGYRYRGRGIGAQFTGKENYIKFGRLFGVELESNPDLAVDLRLGAEILYKGSTEGLFTGVSLSKYITKCCTDYVNARRVINADVARNGKKIAADAIKFERILKKADL